MYRLIRSLSAVSALVGAVTLTLACERDAPTGPAPPEREPAFAIADGAHGGNPHFYFLPPLVSAAAFTGSFDATLSPVVEVCALGATATCNGAAIATFSTTGAAGSERIRVETADELYVVNWHARAYAIEPSAVYRITVKIANTTLGYIDVSFARGGKHKNAPGGVDVASWSGGTVPIKFRIEQGALQQTKPIWKFTILGAVSKQTADYLGGFDAAVRFMRAQVDTLNSRFNTPNVFAGEFRWSLDSIYEYTGTGWEQVTKPHPGFDYKYIVDGYQGPGGWLGDYDVVFLSWPIDQITTPGATDAIVHEFGHARGAIDLYGIKADGQFNPVNGASYHPGRSIMDYPYGETVWDQHSINLINRSADVVHAPPSYITEAFPPSFTVVVVDEAGVPQANAYLLVYPVPWFQNRVDGISRYYGWTDERGEWAFPRNPFEPGYPAPWLMIYPNYLITAYSGARQLSGYGWMPIIDVQNLWFTDPTAPYRLRITVWPSATVTATSASP